MKLTNLLEDSAKILIMIDGHCLLCHGFARFVLGQDTQECIWFGALQDEGIYTALVEKNIHIPAVDSVIVISGGQVYSKSQAILKALSLLPRYRQWTRVGYIVPISRADYIYDFIAKNRIGWFGQKDDCDLQSTRALQTRVVRVYN